MSVQSEIDFIRQIVIHSPGSEHNFTLPKNTQEWVGDKNGKLIQNPDYLLFDDIINSRRYNAVIYKEENVYENRYIRDYIPNNAFMRLLESERIKEKVRNFEHDMWSW